ncbi:protein FAR1-RELATED SEQUENCE 5-like [Apium graveolens]|uniref:protein FAR1-RELATED SEQUENCE 5-like n=1 Tax=Apium graveolens TaxID=4045 RepID=UPI003D7AEDAE
MSFADRCFDESWRGGGGKSVVSSVGGSVDSECSITDYIVSPGGRKYYKPSCVGDINVPFENQVFVSLDKGYIFYKEYVYLGGFGVRKGTEQKDKDDVKTILLKYYVLHNHPLATESGRQFFRSNREMNISLRNIVFDVAKVNIGPSKSFGFAKEQAGGYANVGASLRDFRNFNHDLKSFVGERDGKIIIDKFKLFWVDAIGRRNFELYGDAILFDATFDTNKYNMIFAPFTGVDKHDKCVTFVACLLSHESIGDYTWAFSNLKKVMGRNAVVIVTDQCPAMKVAIRNAFSAENGLFAIKHRLCMWHIMQKFPIKLGNRLCKETDFMEKMKAYIWSSVLEIDEFEIGWKEVIKEFKLEDNKWLSEMYCIRSSWIPTFFRVEPVFGLMRTTSRSESDFFFGQFHRQGDTLCEFRLRFQSAMERQRNETARLDHESKTSIPETLSRWFIEDDATTLFTRAIFYKVQEEIICSCLDMQIKRMSEEIEGVTHMEIRDVKVKDKLFKVSVSRDHVVCSCKKFVMCGIVCRHVFCGLKQIGVTKYPLRLALNCWMKVDISGTLSNSVLVENDYTKMEQASLKLTHIWYDFRQAVDKAGMVFEKLDYVHQTIKQLNS